MDISSAGSGLDFATFMNSALRNNGAGYNNMWGDNGILFLFLLILFGWGGNRNNSGASGAIPMGAATTTNDAAVTGAIDAAIQRARADGLDSQIVLEAVRGNQTAIQTLATTFNTDISNIQQSLCALNAGIDKLSGQIGLSSQQVINAIQTGNMNIVQQLMNCCCETKALILEQGNSTRMATMEQTNTLSDRMRTGFAETHQLIDTQTAQMVAGFQSIKDMFTQNKIDTLQATVNQLQNNANNSAQTAYLQNYINSQLAPVQAIVNSISDRVPNVPQPAYLVNTNTSCGANYAYGNGCNCNG